MSLRRLAAGSGLEIGACTTATDISDESYATLLATEFNRLALENDLKWATVHPHQDTYEFEPADTLVAFADRHDMAVTGHALVWHIDNPDWLTQQSWSSTALAAELRSHIHTLTERYAGRIDTWDVVNEPIDDTGNLRETLWLETLGPEYIADAFRWAAATTDADLFYNDYHLPVNDEKQDRVYRLLANLLDHDVPIDGIGLQLHCLDSHPTPTQIRDTINRFQTLDLEVRITELDVAYPIEDQPDDLETAHADYYEQTVAACFDAGVDSITLWGVTDDRSWLTSWRDYPDHYTQQPLLFDNTYTKKESYDAVARVLRQHAGN